MGLRIRRELLAAISRIRSEAIWWVFPQLEKMPVHNHDGVGGMHLYMPWWRFGKKNEFLRGYHIEFGGGRNMPGVGEIRLCVRGAGGLRRQPEAEMSQLVWHIHWIQRTRRDDSE